MKGKLKLLSAGLCLAGAAVMYACADFAMAQPSQGPSDIKVRVYKGRVPTEPRYLAFQQSYANRAIVDLFVDGQDAAYLLRALEEVRDLQRKKVPIGSIYIVGGTVTRMLDPDVRSRSGAAAEFAKLDGMKRAIEDSGAYGAAGLPLPSWLGHSASLSAVAGELDLSRGEPVQDVDEFLRQYKIEFSPAWIVTYRGKHYIYEGVDSIRRFFDNNGKFADAGERIAESNKW